MNIPIAQCTRSNNPIILKGIDVVLKDWITPSSLRSYIMNDCFSDIVKYQFNLRGKSNSYSTYGQEFEDGLCDIIEKKFPNETKRVYKYDDYELTKQYINDKVPIIFQAALKDDKIKLRGKVDMLVRVDYLNKIYNNIDEDYSSYTNLPYVVVDIKGRKIKENKDGSMSNDRDHKYFKSQTYLYNCMLSNIQKEYMPYSYIMSKGVINKTDNAFEKLSLVDNNDEELKELVDNAIKWVKHIKLYNQEYDLDKLHPDYYPNINVNSYIEEIELLKRKIIDNLTPEERVSMTSYNNEIKERMLNVNQSDEFVFDSDINSYDVNLNNAIFLDFETLSPIVYSDPNKQNENISNFVYMCGFYHNNQYHCYLAKDYSLKSEKRILKKFLKYYKNANEPIIVYYKADKYLFENACLRHQFKPKYKNIICSINTLYKPKWHDLHKYLKDNKFVVKGAFNYRLKDIAKALSIYEYENIDNAEETIHHALEYYRHFTNKENMKDIEYYNKIDCKTLISICKFLKTNYL